MKIILVRHGETLWNEAARCQGQTDVELSPRGKEQARLLANRLAEEKIEAIYSSPLRRALDTAQAVAGPHGLTVIVRDNLKEMDQGELEGKTFAELKELHPDFLQAWRQDPTGLRVPGGESLEELQERAWQVIEEIRSQNQLSQVVAVSHHITILTILCCFLGLPLSKFRRLKKELASITVMEYGERGPALLSLNDTWHLKQPFSLSAGDSPWRRG